MHYWIKYKIISLYFPNLVQVRLIKELYGNQIGELYHSLPYHMIEFVVDDSDWLVHFMPFFKNLPEFYTKVNSYLVLITL